ncbi:MAG: nitroreductase family deazaflavin-dependent oxidoreductase [Halioglobus sp.]
MRVNVAKLEQAVFRSINTLVEPAVRRGIASSALTPVSLIVLESVGFKSGKARRTPLWSLRFGRYRIVSTVRGDRSFWVKNLQQQPRVSYYVGGKRREAEAIVIDGGPLDQRAATLTPALRGLARAFARYSQRGSVLAMLVPVTHPEG